MGGQNSLAKPSSSLVPEKALKTFHTPISISATNLNNLPPSWRKADRVLTSRQKQNKTTGKPCCSPPLLPEVQTEESLNSELGATVKHCEVGQ